jgi:glutathionylspermidine synthase
MQRKTIEVRPDWQQRVESKCMLYHSVDGVPYWDESVYYELTAAEVDVLEAATYELNRICLEAVEQVIEQDRFDEFLIPPDFRDYIRESWERDEHTIYGRFDLSYDGRSPPKLLECNADTPTGLLEAAVIQWFWLQDQFSHRNQFNSIHERLIEAWSSIAHEPTDVMYFAALAGHVEDFMTVNYLRDTAMQADWLTRYIDVEKIGWHPTRQVFTDELEHEIKRCFKLYPWEWMQRERFGPMVLRDTVKWLEPPWKALLSNKAILPVLWEMFPGHANLLPAWFEAPTSGDFVQKPIFGREGANLQVFESGRLGLATDGPYRGPTVAQQLCKLAEFDGKHVCVGSWIVNGWSCGIGLREDDTLITGNLSRFVPHLFG